MWDRIMPEACRAQLAPSRHQPFGIPGVGGPSDEHEANPAGVAPGRAGGDLDELKDIIHRILMAMS
jgi:hypothetical protein